MFIKIIIHLQVCLINTATKGRDLIKKKYLVLTKEILYLKFEVESFCSNNELSQLSTKPDGQKSIDISI